jgi:hypothetical protein
MYSVKEFIHSFQEFHIFRSQAVCFALVGLLVSSAKVCFVMIKIACVTFLVKMLVVSVKEIRASVFIV